MNTKRCYILNDDCIKILPKIKRCDLLLTDIPYDGVNRASNGLRNLDKGAADIATFTLEEFMPLVIKLAAPSAYIFCEYNQVSYITKTLRDNKYSVRLGIWEKTIISHL